MLGKVLTCDDFLWQDFNSRGIEIIHYEIQVWEISTSDMTG